MGNSSINLSLANIWQSWYKFRRDKKSSKELEYFTYYLEQNLHQLWSDLNNENYKHDRYKKFIVTDNKHREISVASVKDRIVHRLLYEYLTEIYDKTFIYDVWSCRKNKGLLGVIERTQKFLSKYPNGFIWRADIKKFFDNVDHEILIRIFTLRISVDIANWLLKEIIGNYQAPEAIREKENKMRCQKGIPIGNLTSQIFANIYLNELDRFVKHTIKPKAYLRYGDDFIIISENLGQLKQIRKKTIKFLREKLWLEINTKNDIIVKAGCGLKFLGVEIFPKGRRLSKRNWNRARERLKLKNIPSYSGMVKQHSKEKRIKEFNWRILEKLNNDF